MDEVTQEAVYRAEQLGIIFIDEIDKIAGKQSNSVDVSREGVQRDILPIVEGSNVATKYGSVKRIIFYSLQLERFICLIRFDSGITREISDSSRINKIIDG